MPQVQVALNGTDENPWHKFGLTQNPFPSYAKHPWSAHCIHLQALGGEPIPHKGYERYIRNHLKGYSDEFVDKCVHEFKPGAYVTFTVEWKE